MVCKPCRYSCWCYWSTRLLLLLLLLLLLGLGLQRQAA
jgi:hypothetical protein